MEVELSGIEERIATSAEESSPLTSPVARFVKQHPMKGVVGVLAELPIRIRDSRYAHAVNTALRAQLEKSVVVTDRGTAAALIDVARREKGGVITCLILDELTDTVCRLKSIPGSLRMVDCLRFPREYAGLVQQVAGKWYIVENKDEAVSVQERTRGVHCVTVDGILFFGNGEVRREACRQGTGMKWRSEKEGRGLTREEREAYVRKRDELAQELSEVTAKVEECRCEWEKESGSEVRSKKTQAENECRRLKKQIEWGERQRSVLPVIEESDGVIEESKNVIEENEDVTEENNDTLQLNDLIVGVGNRREE